MKTAISIPDETYAHAEELAASLGMSRSEFFARAAERYMEQLEAESLTRQIDSALQLVGADDSASAAADAGRRRLRVTEDEW
jgi:predicted DNA-binding protein